MNFRVRHFSTVFNQRVELLLNQGHCSINVSDKVRFPFKFFGTRLLLNYYTSDGISEIITDEIFREGKTFFVFLPLSGILKKQASKSAETLIQIHQCCCSYVPEN
jgi:hypothetical protein